MTDAERFIERVLAPRQAPSWWVNLLGEVRQGGHPPGRYLENTLALELQDDVPHYRRDSRSQIFLGAATLMGALKMSGSRRRSKT